MEKGREEIGKEDSNSDTARVGVGLRSLFVHLSSDNPFVHIV